jgi:hypothetical protein
MDAIPWPLAALIGGGLLAAVSKLYLDGQATKDRAIARLEADLHDERALTRSLLSTADRTVTLAERTVRRGQRDGG